MFSMQLLALPHIFPSHVFSKLQRWYYLISVRTDEIFIKLAWKCHAVCKFIENTLIRSRSKLSNLKTVIDKFESGKFANHELLQSLSVKCLRNLGDRKCT